MPAARAPVESLSLRGNIRWATASDDRKRHETDHFHGADGESIQ
jgi:hypothetical protein